MKRDIDRHYWIVCSESAPLYWTLHITRRYSIGVFLHDRETIKPWNYYYRRGYRCRKVTLVDGWKEVEDE
jgi:hypothetical protein